MPARKPIPTGNPAGLRLRRLPSLSAALFVVALGAPSIAQSYDAGLGFSGLLNVASLDEGADRLGDELAMELENTLGGSWSFKKQARLGPGLGVHFYMMTSSTVGFEVGVQYVRRGAGYDIQSSEGVNIDGQFRINCLEFPLLLRMHPLQGSTVRPMFVVGGVLSILTTTEFELSSEDTRESTDIQRLFKEWAFGYVGGAGLSVRVGDGKRITLQARYLLGTTNLFDDPSNAFSTGFRDLAIQVGMDFRRDNH